MIPAEIHALLVKMPFRDMSLDLGTKLDSTIAFKNVKSLL